MILALKEENEILKKTTEETIAKKYDDRLERIEREINKDRQYWRRDTIEIAGIDPEIHDDDVEDECLKFLKAVKNPTSCRSPSTK